MTLNLQKIERLNSTLHSVEFGSFQPYSFESSIENSNSRIYISIRFKAATFTVERYNRQRHFFPKSTTTTICRSIVRRDKDNFLTFSLCFVFQHLNKLIPTNIRD